MICTHKDTHGLSEHFHCQLLGHVFYRLHQDLGLWRFASLRRYPFQVDNLQHATSRQYCSQQVEDDTGK